MKKAALIFLVTLWSAPHVRAEEKLAGGPYVVNAGQRSATVVWIVERGQASLGTKPDQLETRGPVLRAEKVTFTGLKPGTTYYYNATGTEQGRGSFKTAPSGPSSFQFVVYGDTRTRHDVHRQVIGAILKHADPDLILHTGDLVANGADASLWPVFFDIERELLRKAAFFPALGNHERNDRSFYDFFDLSTRGGVTITSMKPLGIGIRCLAGWCERTYDDQHHGDRCTQGWGWMHESIRGRPAGWEKCLLTSPFIGLSLRPGNSLTAPRAALSVGSIRFVSSTNATQSTGLLTITPVGLSPTEHASFSLDALVRQKHVRAQTG